MSNLLNASFPDIALKFSEFFQEARFTASYKPIILKSILKFIVKDSQNIFSQGSFWVIKIEDIAEFFYKFNLILYKRFNLKQLNNKQMNVAIYRIIDEDFNDNLGLNLPDVVPPPALKKTIKLLFRNVFYRLRNDLYIYDFYSDQFHIIQLKTKNGAILTTFS
jgi:hypothetical protein